MNGVIKIYKSLQFLKKKKKSKIGHKKERINFEVKVLKKAVSQSSVLKFLLYRQEESIYSIKLLFYVIIEEEKEGKNIFNIKQLMQKKGNCFLLTEISSFIVFIVKAILRK